MGRLDKVRPGERLQIPADTYNAFVDAAEAHQRQAHTGGRPSHQVRQTTVVPIRNEAGADLGRFSVLGIEAPIIDPADNAEEFAQRVALRGVTPTHDHAGRYVILLERTRDGGIGRACIDGVCQVRVRMVNEGHGFAEVDDGECGHLRSAIGGSARLLWVQPEEDRDDPEIALAVALIGGRPLDQLYVATADAAGGKVTVRAMNVDQSPTGPEFELDA